MDRMQKRLYRGISCLISASAITLLFTGTSQSAYVEDWTNPIHYPARTIAVHWDGFRLDMRTPVRFGAWTVSFGTPIHYAFSTIFGAGLRAVTIYGDSPNEHDVGRNHLVCSNAAIGARYCTLSFETLSGNTSCKLQVYERVNYMKNMKFFDIPCPRALELAR